LPPIYIAYLNRMDIEELKMTDGEILSAIEACLASQGRGETVIEPRVHLEPGVANGHFNVLRGAIKPPIDSAGVKIVGDFVDNYKIGLPSELAILALFDPRTGAPKAILDASGITDMRTGAVTAVGAKHLARKNSRVLGHIGARGTAYWNVRLLNHLFDFDEIRVHSRREESRNGFAERLSQDLGKPVVATSDWEEELRRLLSGEPLTANPPPAVPPPIRPIIVEGPKPSPLRPPIAAALPAPRAAPSLAESGMAEAERAVDIQLAGLKESTTAYERAGRLQEGVAEQLKEIDELTRTHSGRVPMVRRRLYSEEAAQAVSMIGNPATVRQAIIVSLIFGPPRALEGE